MELKKAHMIATDTIKHYCPEFSFKFDSGKKRFGLCSFSKKTISISKSLTLLNDENEVINTILHEVAHALAGYGVGHSDKWRITAKSIGCDGERCYDSALVIQEPRPYKGVCPGCNRTVLKYRRKRISCGKCDKKYNPSFLFVWSSNT